jgi:Iron-containing redox enzyme
MSTIAGAEVLERNFKSEAEIQKSIEAITDELMAALPDPKRLSSEERRGIIARYTAVLESNFIYWMTATLIATKAEPARPIILENLHEETRDVHPHMMRKFAMAAGAFPTDRDSLEVHEDLTKMRFFLGRLSGVQSVAAMAFFEGFIQKFMPFLAGLAEAQGSKDMEYTDVHGVCDIAHTQGLFRALSAEIAAEPLKPGTDVLEGVYILRALLDKIIWNKPQAASA